MNIIESYNLQKDKENKYNYSNTYTNELNTYFSNYIKAKKKLREQQEQKQLESELIQNINNAIEKTFKQKRKRWYIATLTASRKQQNLNEFYI